MAVLLVVMNWFFHRVYWTGWIAHHHRRRRRLLAGAGAGVTAGLVLLGFTAIYREGFEIVLFLQNLRLRYGAGTVLEGVAVGLAFTAAVGVLTFYAHKKLPYKQMLVLTGAMIGFVLVVMVGESAQELQLAGWLPTTNIGVTFPGWMGHLARLLPDGRDAGGPGPGGGRRDRLVHGERIHARAEAETRRPRAGQAPRARTCARQLTRGPRTAYGNPTWLFESGRCFPITRCAGCSCFFTALSEPAFTV